MDVLVPVGKDHLMQLALFREFACNIDGCDPVFVGGEQVKAALDGTGARFVDEQSGIFCRIAERLRAAFSQLGQPGSPRTGWYFQQFIKMSYCFETACDYVVWDVDTVPLRRVGFLDDAGRSLFNRKSEHWQPYFYVIDRLFDGRMKIFPFSFITEAMHVRNAYMREMIGELGGEGGFVEKIMSSVLPSELGHSGFSEFETYGTYVMNMHPESAAFRDWKTDRYGLVRFKGLPSVAELNSFASTSDLDTVSFENWHATLIR